MNQRTMPRSDLHDNCPVVEPEDEFSDILKKFESFDPTKSSPITPRKTHGRLSHDDKAQVTRSLGFSKTSRSNSHDQSKKSIPSESTAVTSSLSTDPEDSQVPMHTETTEEINKRLEAENKRLKRMLRARERASSKDGSDASTRHKSVKSESDISKLSEKARALKFMKHQFKDERKKSMRMSKHLEAHHIEIEGLQRELAKSLDTIDDLEKDQATDRAQLLRLTNELEEWRKQDAKTPAVKRLESELRQRNDELELTLEMLESKVNRILLLENELRSTNRRLQAIQEMEVAQNGSLQGSLSSLDLHESRAECRRLERQNMMFKLLFEELEESRTGDESESIDSLIQKVAREIGGSVSAAGTGISSNTGTDDDSNDKAKVSSRDNDDRPFLTPGCSPVRKCPSVDDPSASDPSTDASSARAEALFQKEIERFSLDDSSSSFPKSRKLSPRSPHQFNENTVWINPYDL